MATMPYFLAIDAGGTSTRCLLADDTRILARSSTGSIKLQRVSEPEAAARLVTMLEEVSSAAGIPLSEVTSTCIGLAGLTIPAVRTWAERTLAATVAGEIILLGDEEIALDAAFPGTAGILLIGGTGSNCIGRASDGTLHRAGGYGPILGDEGGGYWIGLEATRAALHALDSELHLACHAESSSRVTAATDLLTAIQHHFHLATLPELIELGNRRTEPVLDFATLAPLIARLADAGNPIAISTLYRAASGLAELVTIVASKLTPTTASNFELGSSHLGVAFTGSILTEISTVYAALNAALAQSFPIARLQPTPVDPLLGALHRARKIPM
jgi:glucosamine kinase